MIRLYRPRRRLMLGDIVELTVVVRDLDAAVERFSRLFGLKVHHRAESKEFGFKNAILPTGSATSSLCSRPTPTKPSAGSLPNNAKASISVASDATTIPGTSSGLRKPG